jgi:hypothetical protein
MKWFLALLVALSTIVPLALPISAGGGSALYSPTEVVGGTTLAGWQGAYQIWLNEIPRTVNPLRHPNSPRNCESVDGMVFLGPAGADCVVPPDTPAAFTGAWSFWECSTAEGMGATFAQLRRRCIRNFDRDLDPRLFEQDVVIDGQLVHADRRWISVTPGEMIDFPEENLWSAEPGPSRSVTKGFLFILRPLSEGIHTIRLTIRDEIIGRFRYVWRLRVEAPA